MLMDVLGVGRFGVMDISLRVVGICVCNLLLIAMCVCVRVRGYMWVVIVVVPRDASEVVRR